MSERPESAWPRVEIAPDLIRLAIYGRWVILLTVVGSLTLSRQIPIRPAGLLAVGAVIAGYNLLQWLFLREHRPDHYPPLLYVGIDLVLITLLDWFSGGARSPFLGFYYLWILVAAAVGELRGSILAAATITILEMTLMAARGLEAFPRLYANIIFSTVPYFFLTALASGYLVRRLRSQWEQRLAAEEALVRLENEQASIRHELELAQEVQATYLHTVPPHVPGLDIGILTKPRHGIGGDLIDFLPEAGGMVTVVADISGHSLSAALLAARLSHILEDVGLNLPLTEAPAAWNRAIITSMPAEVFVTAVFFELRYSNERLCYSIAGHPSPLLWQGAQNHVAPLECGGPILGVMEDASYPICETQLATGDVLLLYTDGVTEARDSEGNLLETEGLATLLRGYFDLPAQELVERIGQEVATHYTIRDDFTLAAFRRTSIQASEHSLP